MKIPISCLKEWVDIDVSLNSLAEKLTDAGLEVESILPIGNIDGVVVGELIDISKHPNADRLSVCKVRLKDEEVSIVCGAPNLMPGQKVPVALPGTVLVDFNTGTELKIKTSKIRGVESAGMICSEVELGLSSDHSGIMVLPENTAIGDSLFDVLGDWVFDIAVTPNRSDCFSVMGIAREISVLLKKDFNDRKLQHNINDLENEKNSKDFSVSIENTDLCSRYLGYILDGVDVQESPYWLKRKLNAAGLKSINNVVDITNYVMIEIGQPLHAFDLNLIKDKKIIIRTSQKGELIETLDDESHKLQDGMLVIADSEKPIAIAGVIGGKDSAITDSTKSIIFEAATFSQQSVRKTSSVLKIRTEASSRFEKGINPDLAKVAIIRAVELLLQICPSAKLRKEIDVYPEIFVSKIIELKYETLNKILGVVIDKEDVIDILVRLGFTIQKKNDLTIKVTVPFWRIDITLDVDLIEEVARIIGYDSFPSTPLVGSIPNYNPDDFREFKEFIRDLIVSLGFYETINYPLVPVEFEGIGSLSTLENDFYKVTNPMNVKYQKLRQDLFYGLLTSLKQNRHIYDDPIRFFEIGKVFLLGDNLSNEHDILAGVLKGPRMSLSWVEQSKTIDIVDVKGYIESLFEHLSTDFKIRVSDSKGFKKKKSAEIIINEEVIGEFGEFDDTTLVDFDLDNDEIVGGFWIDLKQLKSVYKKTVKFQAIIPYPEAIRDLSLSVPLNMNSVEIEDILSSNNLVKRVRLLDVYQETKNNREEKFLTYRIAFQSDYKTLVNKEIDREIVTILKSLKEKNILLRET